MRRVVGECALGRGVVDDRAGENSPEAAGRIGARFVQRTGRIGVVGDDLVPRRVVVQDEDGPDAGPRGGSSRDRTEDADGDRERDQKTNEKTQAKLLFVVVSPQCPGRSSTLRLPSGG